MRTFRSVSLVSALVVVAIILAPGRTEARAVYVGSIEIHARICPAGAHTLASEFPQGRAPIGVLVAIDAHPLIPLDGAGNVRIEELAAGAHLVAVTSSPYAERFRQVRALCSHSVTGLYPSPTIVLASDEAQFQVRVAPRSQVTCDIYFIS